MKSEQKISSTSNGLAGLAGDEDTIIAAHNLHRSYSMGKLEVHALRGVDLQVRRGEFVTILGKSGSGKSTLLHLLGALDRPTKGQILLEQVDLSQLSDNQLAEIRLHKVGFVFQFFNLMPQLTAQGNVELPLRLAEVVGPVARKRSQELLELVGLSQRLDHRPSELSGGEQQRVAIARALANQPQIILTDELTGNLDTATGAEIISLLRKVNQSQNLTVIAVGHDKRLTKIADRVIEMQDGKFLDKRSRKGGKPK